VASNGRQRAFGKASLLDVATALVLMITIGLLLKPGGAIHAWWSRMNTDRVQDEMIAEHWDTLSSIAAPLYPVQSGAPEVIEFIDYQCPFCRAATRSVDSALAAGVRIAIVHLPLPIHPPATSAALVSLCAQRFGVLREVHDKLLHESRWYEVPLDSLGHQFDAFSPRPDVQGCIRHMEVEVGGDLQAHVALAAKLGVRSTPYFVARGRVLRGAPSADSLIKLARPR